MKKRGGYGMNLTRQIRLRIPPDMLNSLTQIAEKTQFTLSKVMRELLRLGLRSYHS